MVETAGGTINMCQTPEQFHADFADYRPGQGGGAPSSVYLASQICKAVLGCLMGRRIDLPVILDDEE